MPSECSICQEKIETNLGTSLTDHLAYHFPIAQGVAFFQRRQSGSQIPFNCSSPETISGIQIASKVYFHKEPASVAFSNLLLHPM